MHSKHPIKQWLFLLKSAGLESGPGLLGSKASALFASTPNKRKLCKVAEG